MKSVFSSWSLILSTLLTIVSPLFAHAGGSVGGGGYALKCRGSFYSYDYKITETEDSKIDSEIAKATKATQILEILATRLQKMIPQMAESLRDFMKFNKDPFLTKEMRLWVPGTHPLFNIHNEARIRVVPECDQEAVQAVIWKRKEAGGLIIYNVDPKIIQLLAATSPIQLSFLYVHEWLRDYTQDPEVLANVARLLHRDLPSGWAMLTGDILRQTLVNLGLDIRELETFEEMADRVGNAKKTLLIRQDLAATNSHMTLMPEETISQVEAKARYLLEAKTKLERQYEKSDLICVSEYLGIKAKLDSFRIKVLAIGLRNITNRCDSMSEGDLTQLNDKKACLELAANDLKKEYMRLDDNDFSEVPLNFEQDLKRKLNRIIAAITVMKFDRR